MTRLALWGAFLVAGVAAQDSARAYDLEALVPSDWTRQNLEARWVIYRADLERHPADKDRKPKWVRWLGTHGDFELLEWMVVYEGWGEAGAELRRCEAPQWARAALWNLASSDSHDSGSARKALEGAAGRVLGWVKRYPIARRGADVESFLDSLARSAQPGDPGALLPPLDDAAVLLSYFDAPKELATLAPGDRVEAGQRYVHQIVRALRGARTRTAFIAPHVDKMANLLGHPHATVRAETASALSSLPGDLVPHERLLAVATAVQEPALQRLATLTMSFSTHPAAFFALHDIAADSAHPGVEAARQRLADIGDEFSVAWMLRTGIRLPEVVAALASRTRPGEADARQTWLQITFERAAWAVASEHAAASLATRALLDAVRARAPHAQRAVEALKLDAFEERWHPGDLSGEVKRAMVRLRDGLQRELGKNR